MAGGLNQDLRYALPQLGRSQAFANVADCVVRRNRSSLVAQRLPAFLERQCVLRASHAIRKLTRVECHGPEVRFWEVENDSAEMGAQPAAGLLPGMTPHGRDGGEVSAACCGRQ